ncbi:hypothetical protein [Nocardia sp. NPDC051832]|uniref:hypothetical protein n=1 Tax=Nocardia sp. NPDC051832 TaxID=3155673 RepID=UPI0034273574
MGPDTATHLRIFKAYDRPATLSLLSVRVIVVRDRRLSWTAIGMLSYLLTQQSRVVDYYRPAIAGRGRITVEQLADAVALLVECGYLVPFEDGWRVRSRGDRKQRYPYG